MMQPETIEYLCTLDWPGNVRQLQNTCRWMSTMVLGDHVYLEDLPADLTRHDFKLQNQQPDKEQDEGWEALLRQNIKARLIEGDRDVASQIVDSVERLMIEIAIDCTHGRRVQAADILGYGRNTLSRKLKRFNRHSGTMA